MQSEIYRTNKCMLSKFESGLLYDQNVAARDSELLHLCFLGTLVGYRLNGGFSFPKSITIQPPVLLTDIGEELTEWLLWSQG